MPSYALLLSGLEIIHEGKIQYIRLGLYLVVTLLIGVGLWLVGFDLLESDRKAYRIGGVFVLILATGFSLGVALLCYWQYTFFASALE
jgi:hypothetical protein